MREKGGICAEIHSAPYNMAPEVTMDTSISWME